MGTGKHWIETKVIFEAEDPVLATDLVSEIFYEAGVQGVWVEDPTLDPPEGWGEDAVKPSPYHAVNGYFPKTGDLRERLAAFEAGIAGIEGIRSRILYRQVDEEDWAESWKAYFHPQHIAPGIVVKPTWRDYSPSPSEMVIEIDPGMAFGTGTHPTTALCVRALSIWITAGSVVLDVGTGSGILMVAAAKLGAGKVFGVDIDPMAVEIAGDNLVLNRVPPEQWEVSTGHLTDTVSHTCDLVVANILSEVIVTLLDDIPRVLKTGGIFIGSGIISDNQGMVVEKMKRLGFTIRGIETQDSWVCIVGSLDIP